MNNNRGFTLIELLVTISLIGILTVVAMTTFGGSSQKSKLDSASRQLMADMQYIQAKSMNGSTTYQIMLDKANNRYYVLPDGVHSERTVNLPQGIEFAGTSFNNIWFDTDGTLIQHITDGNDYAQLRVASQTSQKKYVIVQLITGRIRIDNVPPS